MPYWLWTHLCPCPIPNFHIQWLICWLLWEKRREAVWVTSFVRYFTNLQSSCSWPIQDFLSYPAKPGLMDVTVKAFSEFSARVRCWYAAGPHWVDLLEHSSWDGKGFTPHIPYTSDFSRIEPALNKRQPSNWIIIPQYPHPILLESLLYFDLGLWAKCIFCHQYKSYLLKNTILKQLFSAPVLPLVRSRGFITIKRKFCLTHTFAFIVDYIIAKNTLSHQLRTIYGSKHRPMLQRVSFPDTKTFLKLLLFQITICYIFSTRSHLFHMVQSCFTHKFRIAVW